MTLEELLEIDTRLKELERKDKLQSTINKTLAWTVICFSLTNLFMILKEII